LNIIPYWYILITEPFVWAGDKMLDEERPLYTIGTVADLLGEHPETLRVWERNGLISPQREGNRRKYSNLDLKRLKFIKFMIDEQGLNIAGVRQVTRMYSCWFRRTCRGGARKNSNVPVNESKPCWKEEGTFCLQAKDKAEFCHSCERWKRCRDCADCN
jgi:MerR family transcriptional regulator/heat shock protein HspR